MASGPQSLLLLICLLNPLGVVGRRRCHHLLLQADAHPVVFPLPAGRSGHRIYVPFSVLRHSSVGRKLHPGAALKLMLGSGTERKWTYVFTLYLDDDLATVGKMSPDLSAHDSVLAQRAFIRKADGQPHLHFYIRFRSRHDVNSLSLFHGFGQTDLDHDPILYIQDRNDLDSDITALGFTLTNPGGSNDTLPGLEVLRDCRSAVLDPCIHPVECVAKGATCALQDGLCRCGHDHAWSALNRRCVEKPIRLGERCSSSSQCASLGAKCRLVAGSSPAMRTCQCSMNSQITDQNGKCIEAPDNMGLDLGRLGRTMNWLELNPGRIEVTEAVGARAQVPHCRVLTNVTDHWSTWIAFPVPWQPVGFQVDLQLHGHGSLVVRLMTSLSRSVMEFRINPQPHPGHATGRLNSQFWIAAKCQRSPGGSSCLVAMKNMADQTDPFRMPSHPQTTFNLSDPLTFPTHLALLSGQPGTHITAGALCGAE